MNFFISYTFPFTMEPELGSPLEYTCSLHLSPLPSLFDPFSDVLLWLREHICSPNITACLFFMVWIPSALEEHEPVHRPIVWEMFHPSSFSGFEGEKWEVPLKVLNLNPSLESCWEKVCPGLSQCSHHTLTQPLSTLLFYLFLFFSVSLWLLYLSRYIYETEKNEWVLESVHKIPALHSFLPFSFPFFKLITFCLFLL